MNRKVIIVAWVVAAAWGVAGQNLSYAWSTLLETPLTSEFPSALFELGNGDFALFGYTQYGTTGTQSSALFRFNAQGDTLFSLTFAGKQFGKVIGLSNDRFLAFQWSATDTACWAYWIDRDGVILREKKLVQGLWKGLYANFNVSGDGSGDFDVLAVRTDSSGSHVIVDARVDSLLDSLRAGYAAIDTVYQYAPAIWGKVNGSYILCARIYMSTYGFSHLKYDLMNIDSAGRRSWTVRLLPTTFSSQSLLSYGWTWFEVLPSGSVSLLLSTSPIGGTHPMETEWIIISSAGAITRQKLLGQNILYNTAFPLLSGEKLFIGYNQQTRYVLKTDSLGNQVDIKTTEPFAFSFSYGQALLSRDSGLVFADRTQYGTRPYENNQDIVLSKLGSDVIAVENGPAHDAGRFPAGAPLFQACPNPFNSATAIHYNAGLKGRLEVFDAKGWKVFSRQVCGQGRVVWNAGDMASGLYVCRLTAGRGVRTRTVVLTK